MEETDGTDTYVAQLKEVFDSCDVSGSGQLNELELNILCEKLDIPNHANILVHHLLGKEGKSEVTFKDFKECFVAVLSQSSSAEYEEEDGMYNSLKEEDEEREVSPKFTLGRKKYGRWSRPEDDDSPVSSSPVSTALNSFDQSSSSPIKLSKSKCDSVCSKRPVSPSYNYQPPLKSGRMTSSHLPNNAELGNDSDDSREQPKMSSELDPNLSFEQNPIQYLQLTWEKLGIGEKGYLNVEELALVCEQIGMDMTEEVVAQLFEKLDCDQDGQISFEEFLQGFFQHGMPEICDSDVEKDKKSNSMYKEGSRDDHQISTSSISGIFSCIDSSNTGYADASAIVELWESLELPCGPQLLEDMGFNPSKKINLSELSSVLEDELSNAITSPLGQLTFLSYQNELQYMRHTFEQIRNERDKLRVNVEEANTRAALLAQEVDDNHAKLEGALKEKLLFMEKKYQEQIRELVEELQQEREILTTQANTLRQQLTEEMKTLREEDSKLKSGLNILEQENSRLEHELQEATEKFLETERLNEVFQKELALMPNLKERLADLESHHGELQEHRYQAVVEELEQQKKVNQDLQDKIDELAQEIESLQQPSTITDSMSNKCHNRTNSWLSDYKKATLVGFKRRGSESSSDDNSDDESPTTGKIRRTFLSIEAKQLLEPEIQEENCDADEIVLSKLINPLKELKENKPTSMDVLLRDLFVDRSHLMKKLHLSMQMQQMTEKSNCRLRCKCKLLAKLLKDVSQTAFV